MEIQLTVVVTILISLSIAVERVVEITKGFIPRLDKVNDDPRREAVRRAILHVLACGAGIVISYFAYPVVSDAINATATPDRWGSAIALGLLASGGSGFWNSILGYVGSLKTMKAADAQIAKKEAELPGVMTLPEPREGRFVL
jgi:hypothetical protein